MTDIKRILLVEDNPHDVELTLGLSALRFVGDFDLRGVLALSRELNRYFQVGNDATNLRAEVTLTWRVR